MLLQTFKTIEEALTKELFEDLDHAETIGIISEEEAANFWYNKKEGMQFINP